MDISSNQIFYIANPNKYILSQHGRQKKKDITFVLFIITCTIIGPKFCYLFIVVVVALLFYVHGKHLRSCRDGQLT